MVAAGEALLKFPELLGGGAVAEADPPGGQGVPAVPGDGQDGSGGGSVRGAGGLPDTQTPSRSRALWKAGPRTPSTLRFRMWGTASSGLLIRTLGKAAKNRRSSRLWAETVASRSAKRSVARERALVWATARPRAGVPLR